MVKRLNFYLFDKYDYLLVFPWEEEIDDKS